jgi:hypothetical protein
MAALSLRVKTLNEVELGALAHRIAVRVINHTNNTGLVAAIPTFPDRIYIVINSNATVAFRAISFIDQPHYASDEIECVCMDNLVSLTLRDSADEIAVGARLRYERAILGHQGDTAVLCKRIGVGNEYSAEIKRIRA